MKIEFPTLAAFLNRIRSGGRMAVNAVVAVLLEVGDAVGCTLHKDREPMDVFCGNQGGTADHDFVPFEGRGLFLSFFWDTL